MGVELAAWLAAWLAAELAAGLAGMLVSDPCESDTCVGKCCAGMWAMWATCCGGEGEGTTGLAGCRN